MLSGIVLKYLYPLYVKGENIEIKKHFSVTSALTSILAVFLTVLSFTFSDLIILIFASSSVVSEILSLGTFFISGIFFSFAMLYQQQLELAKLYRPMAITRAVGGLISLIMLSTVLYVEEHRFIDEVFALTMLVFFLLSFNAVSRIKDLSFD